MNRYTQKECANCGKVTKSTFRHPATSESLCKACFEHTFELYTLKLKQKQRMAESLEAPVVVKTLPQKIHLFVGHNESFAERVAMMEAVTDVWRANGITWNDYLEC